jgi:beta-glucosidase
MSRIDRFAKAVNAGVDQFGGVTTSDLLVEAVEQGKIANARIDESARRILLQKFEQGLFEDPYVVPEKATDIVGNPEFVAKATFAQAKSAVLLENRKDILPLQNTAMKLYLYQIDPAVAISRGFTVVAAPSEADVAIVRMSAPYQIPHSNYFFGSRQQEGDLDFKPGNADLQAFDKAAKSVPTIATVYLSRPAILGPLKREAAALIGNFGMSDGALFDVLQGNVPPLGKLPFELPSSMAEVDQQRSDVPHDTAHPLYPIHTGLSYDR